MQVHKQNNNHNLRNEHGIAIGPILFVVAILGILAAAIAAGSGAFSGDTTSESNNIKSSAFIEIGENLKTGVERLVANDIALTNINFDPTVSTSNSNDLFAPTGGGIAPPSAALLGPAHNQWQYLLTTTTNGWGTAADDLLVYGFVPTQSLCEAINRRANGVTPVPTVNIAILATGTPNHTAFTADFGPLRTAPVGCFYTSHVWSIGYWFYQVLAVQ